MWNIKYLANKVLGKALSTLSCRKVSSNDIMSQYFRRCGMTIGNDTHIYSNICTPESYLIEIGDNVTISNDVKFITHDSCVGKTSNGKYTDLFGKIKIGNNCFVGSGAVLMYGVTLCDNVIVAAGSVVTNTFEKESIIIGGNPAKIISSWDSFNKKAEEYAYDMTGLSMKEIQNIIENKGKLVERKDR